MEDLIEEIHEFTKTEGIQNAVHIKYLPDLENPKSFFVFLLSTYKNILVLKINIDRSGLLVSNTHAFSCQEIDSQEYLKVNFIAPNTQRMKLSQTNLLQKIKKTFEDSEKTLDIVQNEVVLRIEQDHIFTFSEKGNTLNFKKHAKVIENDFGQKMLSPFLQNKRNETLKNLTLMKNLSDKIKEKVKGQSKVVQDMLFFMNQMIAYEDFRISTKPNLLITGPSGTGKTFVAKVFSESIKSIFNKKINFIDFDMSRITSSGFKGINVDQLIAKISENQKEKESTIVFLDEIDSIFLKKDNSSSDIIKELLKLLESNSIDMDSHKGNNAGKNITSVNLENVYFILAGAFHGKEMNTKEDIIHHFGDKTGIHELLGRINKISYTSPLKKQDLINILSSPQGNMMRTLDNLYNQGFIIDNVSDLIDSIAQKAIESNFGARKLNELINDFSYHVFIDALSRENLDIKEDKLEIEESFLL